MTEKYIPYKLDGETYNIPESLSSTFEQDYPSASIEMHIDNDVYDIPLEQKAAVLKDYPNAVYTFGESIEETSDDDNKPSWGESLVKGAGAGFTRAGKGIYDALVQLSSGMLYNDPETGEAKKTKDYDVLMKDESDPIRNASVQAGELAERLSKEADPTNGEKGFVDLIKEGKIGTALQKGLAVGAESLPMTLSAANPYTMALNAISMAGANYAEQTLENPEVDKVKRAAMAIGSAALEQAIEKFADPVFKYIGGGKGAGQITEWAAKELLEKSTKEGAEEIAKRILGMLKNTGKEALGEGVEEIASSAGNDLLGGALDLISGDKDYGIQAQWNEYKEANPDATKKDFALAKGKEYMDSFIGGALSGGYMTGSAQAINEGVNFVVNKSDRNRMQQSYNEGASLDMPDMYDTNANVNDSIEAASTTFTGENGESSYSNSFFNELTAEQAFELSRREEFSPEQRRALNNLANAKAVQEGLNQKLDNRINDAVSQHRSLIETVAENGIVVTGVYNGAPVYVEGGVVENGVLKAAEGVSGPLVIVNAMTGERGVANSSDIASVESANAEEYVGGIEQMLRTNDLHNREVFLNTMSPRAKFKAIQPYAGKKILIDLGNGTTEVFVQNISNNGDVVIKGKKGDLGGQAILTIGSDVFYDSIYRDSDGNPVVTEAGAQETERVPETEVTQTPVETDFRDFADIIIINGKPIKVDEVTSQDDVSDSITYRYTDENGVQRTGNATIGTFAEAVNLARQQTETSAPAPASVGETTVPPTEQTRETPTPTTAPAPTEQTEQTPVDWETMLDFEPENYLAEMQNRYGDKIVKMLNAVLSATQRQLDKLNKATPEAHEEMLQNEVKKDILQARIDKLGEMVARLSIPVTPEVPVDSTPVAETPETPVEQTSVPTANVPTEPVEEPTPAAEIPEVPAEPIPAPETPVAETPTTPEVPTTPEPMPAPETPTTPQAPVQDKPTPATQNNRKGGAISRMIGEAKNQVAKLAAKAKIKDFILEDNARPIMGGILRKNGYEYASDAHILVKIKAQYPAEQEGKVYSANTGQELTGRFPNADMIISSAESINTEIDANVDDILATAQVAEELKKGLDKNKKIYIRIGRSIFDSSYLLKAARMAKQQGLTTISQHPTEQRAMLFAGENGVVLIMPMSGSTISSYIIDSSTGEAIFNELTPLSVRTPTTLKGIETARTTLEAVLPNSSEAAIERLKDSGIIQYVDGKVFYNFLRSDIVNAKSKAKDPNTFNALEDIEKNGLEIPLSASEIAKLFPESVAPESPTKPTDITPVAPNPVANPIDEARKKERQLATNLKKIGLSPEHKQDLAYNAGKAIADMFATREEYDDYAESATDFGQYNADFERGVDDSFAARNQQNTSNPPVNSVPLENEPNGENNGEQQPTSNEPTTEGRGSDTTGGGTNDGGNQEGGEGTQKTKSSRRSKGEKSGEQVEDKYPARKGNATQKLLVDTFGFESVTIPNARKEILNTIYDFMMEMSKTLGISPKSIGQGGWLSIGNMRSNKNAIAAHQIKSNTLTRDISEVSLRFKYARLSSIAHEWWHSLDRALGYFNTGKLEDPTSEVRETSFTGRAEVWEAVKGVMDAINNSGYTARIEQLVKRQPRAVREYFLRNTEQVARSFDEYITNRFAEAGITIDNYDNHRDDTQPTAEEMKVIAPAIENIFSVLKEKEGKKSGTSILYQIGEIVDTNVSQEAHQLATQAVLDMLRANGIAVVEATDDMVEQMLRSPELIEKMSQSKSVEEFDAIREKSKEEHGIVAANLSDRILRVTKVPLHNFSGSLIEATEKANNWALENIITDKPITIHEGTTDEFTYIINKSSVKEFFEGPAFRKSEKYVKAAYLSVIGNINEVISNCIETEVHPDYIDKKDGKRDVNGRISFDVLIHEYRGVVNVDGQPFKIKLIFKETRSTSQGNPVYAYNLETIKLSGVTSEEVSKEVAQQTLYAPNSLVSATKVLNGIDKSYDKGKNLLEESYKTSKKVGKYEIIQTTQGTVYGWTDGKNIYLTNAGINPNTPIHEYTHLWARAMMQKNPKGWNSIKQLLKGTPVWNEVMNDANYSNIHGDEDAVASEALSRISGSENAAKMEKMAQQMIDEAKGTGRKLETRGLIQNMKDALNKFWNWVGTNLFGIEKFESVEQVTDRVLYDLLNKTELDIDFSENSLTSQSYENTEDAYTSNDGRGIQPETEGVQGEVSMSGPLGEGRRLARPENGKVSQDGFAGFNPIYEREGESDRQRNNREAKLLSVVNNLTSDERVNLYGFLKDYIYSPSGILRGRADDFINSIRQKGNDVFADFVEDFINDELKYREGISAATTAKHGFLVGIPYDASRLEQIFDAYNEDKYNETLFDRAIRLAKRFGVSIKFATRNEDGSFFSAFGNYNPSDNTITLDANLLVDGNTAELCQTIVHELIHSVVARAASIMSGRAVDNNKQFIDPQSLPKDVIEGINILKEVYEAIKDDGTFQDTYGKKDFEEMLSEITDSKFRGLLKAKKLWKKFLNGICRILGIADESSSESDALTEIESALDKILSSAERGELDSAYASYLGQLAEGYTLDDLQRLESGPVKTMLTQNKLFKTGIDPTEVATQTASLVYDKVVNASWQEFQRQFQDAFQPVRIAIEAIQQETGNIPIEDYENYLLIQNQSSSRSRVEIDNFARRYYSPIIEQINSIIDKIILSTGLDTKNKEHRASVYNELKKYLIAKHGLERNEYYQTHNTRKLTAYEQKKENDIAKKDYDDKVDAINNDATLTDAERQLQLRDALDEYNAILIDIKTREVPDLRDYSGLTTLFGFKPKNFREAEDDARQFVNDFEVRLGRVNDAAGEIVSQSADIDALWKKINAATDKTLKHSYESGLLSRQQYNDIKSMFSFYIPLRGFDETTAEDVYSYARFEGNRFNPAVQTAKGRTSIADDPIAIIMNMAESEIAQGNKNRAKQALYSYLLNRIGDNNSQNSLMQIEEVWYVKTVDSTGNEVYVIATPNYSAGETYEEFENRMKALEATDDAYKSKRGNKVDVGMRFQKQMNRNAHYVYLKVNGVEKAIYINGDPKAADAINGAQAQPLSEGVQLFRDIQRNISSTFTNYSLEFTARNYFRDMLYSHINIGVRESDPAYRKKFRQNWRRNNMGTMLKMLKAYRAGEFDGRPLNEDEAAFVSFMENGGQTGYTLIHSVEAHKRDLQKAIERMQKGIEKGGVKDSAIFKATLGGIELLNEASELITRFAAYKTSVDMGRGINRAINDAKEVTVNFNTRGAQDGKGWMGALARYFGWSKYFFNASVQGVQNIKAMADANRLKFCTTVGGVIATGFMMPIIVGVIAEILGGDDDDENAYWNIPEYDRQNNLCIPVGNGLYAKIPLPIGFREVYAIGDMVAAMAFDKKFTRDASQVGMDIANKISSILLPINPLESSVNGLNFWHTFLYTALPSTAQFAIQNATNVDWKGAPLQKEYTYNEDDPSWMKAYASNPDWMTGLSKWCNEHINLDGDYKGLDWSPEKLDNTLSNLFGGIYSVVKKSGNAISMVWNEENRDLYNVPLAGVVIGSGIGSDEDFITDSYYDMKEYYDSNLGYIKRRAEKFGYDLDDVFLKQKGAHHPKMQEIYSNDNFDFMQEWYKGNNELDKLNDKIKNIEKKIAEKEKPSQSLIEKLAREKVKFEAERREFVNDMLELD